MILIYPVLFYMILCSYFFVFRIKVFKTYGLQYGKKTNIIKLYNTSTIFAYFTFPITANFYNLFMNKHETSFEKTFGEFKMIKIGG